MAARCDASMLPLCYAAPHFLINNAEWEGACIERGSILASHTAVPGSNLNAPQKIQLNFLSGMIWGTKELLGKSEHHLTKLNAEQM